MILIELTEICGTRIVVGAEHIQTIIPLENGTRLSFSGGVQSVVVTELHKTIMEKIAGGLMKDFNEDSIL